MNVLGAVSEAGWTLLGDIWQFNKDTDDGWVGFENGCNGYYWHTTVSALRRRGLIEADQIPGGFKCRLTGKGNDVLEKRNA